ncbi:MAG: hypothetical protein ACK4NC_03040 [Candidatus Gracilibacteria bacterium]
MNLLKHIERTKEKEKIEEQVQIKRIEDTLIEYFSIDKHSIIGQTFRLEAQWLAEQLWNQIRNNEEKSRFIVDMEGLRFSIYTNLFIEKPELDITKTILRMPSTKFHTFVNSFDAKNKKEVFVSPGWEKYMIFEDFDSAQKIMSQLLSHFEKEAHDLIHELPFMGEAIVMEKK